MSPRWSRPKRTLTAVLFRRGGGVRSFMGSFQLFFFVFLFTGSFKFPIFVELRVPLRFEVLEGLRT